MKKFLKMLVERTSEFVTNRKQGGEPVKFSPIVSMIQLALQKKSGVHVIFQDKSFTGDIVKYDQEREQLIVKNFQKNMTVIIRVPDIKRIRLVPNTIREAQTKKS
ncbi:hypothetical protein [Streptococcus massiliensis]|uniref:Uncharacterized protein n=1 Tax=Streptococcus massiliensis TaxID=313439 RepID=A0A380KZ44_9STRE|nr:hypothetical protein [Streptococcus massiliensis]SUN76206.1 Uncharacterised protein [Streptococcus massiliensis]